MFFNKKSKKANIGEGILLYSLLVITVYIPFHAFFSVWLGSLTGQNLVFKSWKEALLLLLVGLVIYIGSQRPDKLKQLIGSRINQLAVAFVVLHAVIAVFLHADAYATAAGLAIDTRYVIFFLLIRAVLLLRPKAGKLFIKVFVISTITSLSIALLQQYVLPADFLKYFGYSKETIAPYLTVDNNENYVRINGTLRGPNPLGVYVMMALAALTAYVIEKWRDISRHRRILCIIGIAACGSLLYASHSRSAMLAAATAFVLVGLMQLKGKYLKLAVASLFSMAIVVGGLYYTFRSTDFVMIVIDHKDPNDPVGNDSNLGHLNSLIDGSARVLNQPFGAGVGTTGSASLYGDSPLIIENQYLFIAHEAGWLGLLLYLALTLLILYRLFALPRTWFVVATLASGVGILVVGLLLPVLTDDTIAYLWWGLAAIALSGQSGKSGLAKIVSWYNKRKS